jgi:chloramphenicol-sensitive protein RarD
LNRPHHEPHTGLAYGIAAYGLWGLMPFYFWAVRSVPPIEVLAHRIVWSLVLLVGVVVWLGRWGKVVCCLRTPRTRWLLAAGTLLLAINWYVYIYGVSIGQLVQNSLGYFITPLLNILLGVVFFRERLRPVQWLALALAAAGLVYLVAALGEWPWIAFTLGSSFALYGLIRKVVPVDTLVGLTVETLLLGPAALVAVVWWAWTVQGAMGAQGLTIDLLLLASGVVTAVPLFCFGQAARQLRLSTLGFLQYLGPSIQFLLAVLIFGESFLPAQQVSFPLIWSALLLVSIQAALARRARPASDLVRGDRPPPQSVPKESAPAASRS